MADAGLITENCHLADLIIVNSEIRQDSKKRYNGNREPVLAERLDPENPGGIQGKKKLRILTTICADSIITEFLATL